MMVFGWHERLSWSYIKGDITKSVLLFLAMLISFTALLFAIGFHQGASQMISDVQYQFLDSQFFKAAKKETFALDSSPLSLVKTSRPTMSEMAFLNNYADSFVVSYNYEIFFPGNYSLSFRGQQIDRVSLVPVYSFVSASNRKKLLAAGTFPMANTLNDVVINTALAELIGGSKSSLIHQTLNLEVNSPISAIDGESQMLIEESFSYRDDLTIIGIVEELSFLNEPKLYYSFSALELLLDGYRFSKIKDKEGNSQTCQQIIALAPDDNYLSNYCLNIFALDEEAIGSLTYVSETLVKSNSSLEISSTSLMIQKTYQELMNATFYSMVVFVIIAIIGTCSIIATGSYSLFIAKKKDSAILSCLGARRRDVIKIFVDYTVAIVIGAALVSLPISLYLERTANNLLYQYFMFKNLIAIPYASFLKTPFLLLFILIASSLVVSCGCTILPILVYKKFSLAEELRDE